MRLAKPALLAALTLVAGLTGAVIAQQAKPDKKQIQLLVDQMSATAPEHKLLDPLVGTFAQAIEYTGGGGAPVAVSGEARGKWVLGKRFVNIHAESAPGEEFKFESIAYFGFDTNKKKFTAFGLDTAGTYAVTAQGDYDAEKKRWVLEGESDEPGIGRVPFQFVISLGDNGSWSHEVLFKMPGAQEFNRVAKTVYTRK
jgi:hypothetical protein